MLKKLFVEKTDDTLIQFFRSLFVGGIATIADMGALALAVECFHINIAVSTALGFLFGLAVNYLISAFWVFKKSDVVHNRAAEFAVFSIIGVVGLLLNEVIIHLFDQYVSSRMIFGNLIPQDKYYLAGKIVATVVVFIWNFGARKLILYRKKNH